MVYNPGQAAALFPLLRRGPSWLVLGGPGPGDEAQTFSAWCPHTRVLAAEPVAAMRSWQLANGFPEPGLLLPVALDEKPGRVTLRVPAGEERRSSGVRDVAGAAVEVDAVAIDQLAGRHGVRDAVLWLDVEGMEVRALRGAERLFAAGEVILANVEVLPWERPGDAALVEAFMARHGMTRVQVRRDYGCPAEDRVYVRHRHPALALDYHWPAWSREAAWWRERKVARARWLAGRAG